MRTAPLLLLLPALAACTPNDTTLGGAVRHNIALQVVDPDPQAGTDLIEGGSGERAAAAIERYNKGEVTEPVTIKTTSQTSSGPN